MLPPIALDRAELLEVIQREAIRPGHLALSRGGSTDWYADLRLIGLSGRTAPLVGRVMLDLVRDWEIEAAGGLTLGADPVAVAMMHQGPCMGRLIDAFVVRKGPKNHGRQMLIEGPSIYGRSVVVVEDTSTTGTSALEAVAAAQAAGAAVMGVAVLLDRGGGQAVNAFGLPYRSAFSSADLRLGHRRA